VSNVYGARRRDPRPPWWVAVGLLIAAAAAVAVLVAELSTGTPSPPPEVSVSQAPQQIVRSASPAQLRKLVASLGHPVYWAGARSRARYELTTTSDDRVYIRYLPAGVRVGSARQDFLTIGTYEVADPVADLRAAARSHHATLATLRGGAISYYDRARPQSVYIAYPETYEQVEVYDPSPAGALRLVRRGEVTPVR
jgi:hypothetical protein